MDAPSDKRNKSYFVTYRKPIQLMPCPGVRAAYRQEDGSIDLYPILAIAICEVRTDEMLAGEVIERGDSERQLCGVTLADGIDFAEEATNLVGYLHPGESPPKEWGRIRYNYDDDP